MLLVLEWVGTKHRGRQWRCICDCGQEMKATSSGEEIEEPIWCRR